MYISFYFEEDVNHFAKGFVEFALESDRVESMTFGGSLIINDHLGGYIDDLFTLDTVNPFIDLDLG